MSAETKFQLLIDPNDHRTFGPCNCCGNTTHRVWGHVNQGNATIAAYFVEWTPGHADEVASFDLVLGKWGSETEAVVRKAVALAFRQTADGPQFMVVNAADRQIGVSSLAGEALKREQVIGHPIAETVFALCDLIFLRDDRIAELREPHP